MIAATIALAAPATKTSAHCSQLTADSAAMPDPQTTIRQAIVDKVILRLARISIANGFQTDIGETLATDEAKQDADWPTHMAEGELVDSGRLAVFDQDNEIEWADAQSKTYSTARNAKNTIGLQVRWFHKRSLTPAELRTGIGDIWKAIISHETTGEREPTFADWNAAAARYEKPLLLSLRPVRDGFVVPRETFQIDACAVEFEATFVTQPFSAVA